MTQPGNQSATKVSVIGLGSMGSAIARTFLQNDFVVTVWNRDHQKAAPFLEMGAVLASDAASAIEASPVTVICVSDYKASAKILQPEEVVAALQGKLLVQLSTGTPKDARDLDSWMKSIGGVCLNGDILAWPSQIGGQETTITYSGENAVFKQHENLLRALAGNSSYAGADAGASGALFAAVLAYLAGSWIGFCHGALVCETEGLRVDEFGELIRSIAGILGEESKNMGEVIQHNRFTDPESTVKTTGDDLDLLVQHAAEAGISKELPLFAANIFRKTINEGYGAEEHAAIIKILRKS